MTLLGLTRLPECVKLHGMGGETNMPTVEEINEVLALRFGSCCMDDEEDRDKVARWVHDLLVDRTSAMLVLEDR